MLFSFPFVCYNREGVCLLMSNIAGKDRKKRVQRLKKLIIYGIVAAILLPTVLSIYLGIRLHQTKVQVAELQQELWKASQQAAVSDKSENGTDEVIFQTEEESIRAWENMERPLQQTDKKQNGIRKVYLTFDDGPSTYTGEILDILKEYDVKATFFVVGKGKKSYESLYRRIVEEGHTLGMHSYSHVYADIYDSKEAFVKDVNALQDYLHEVTGIYPEVYRFPGGSSNRASKVPIEELKAYLDEIGVQWYDWNISSGDATAKLDKDQIVTNCVSGLEGYREAVILMHDAANKHSTVEALPEIIEAILDMEDTVIVPITSDTVPIQH